MISIILDIVAKSDNFIILGNEHENGARPKIIIVQMRPGFDSDHPRLNQ